MESEKNKKKRFVILDELAWNTIIISYIFLIYFISVVSYDDVIPIWLGGFMLYVMIMPLVKTNRIWGNLINK